MSDQVESTEELRRLVIAEIDRIISKQMVKGDFHSVEELKKMRLVFMERNFEVLPDGTVKYI